MSWKKCILWLLGVGVAMFLGLVLLGIVIALRQGANPRPTKVGADFSNGKNVHVSPKSAADLQVGQVFVIGPGPSFPCASTIESLPELMDRQRAMLDENAPDSVMNELADALMRARSIMLGTRDKVQILGKQPGLVRVRLLNHSGKYGFAYMNEAARGCWLDNDALLH
jgi:hypothetical protein